MENVKLNKKGDILTISVDLSKSGEPSKSGKSIVIASSKGNIPLEVDKDFFIGLNIYKLK